MTVYSDIMIRLFLSLNIELIFGAYSIMEHKYVNANNEDVLAHNSS